MAFLSQRLLQDYTILTLLLSTMPLRDGPASHHGNTEKNQVQLALNPTGICNQPTRIACLSFHLHGPLEIRTTWGSSFQPPERGLGVKAEHFSARIKINSK